MLTCRCVWLSVWCCKEQYFSSWTWNIRFINQSKLDFGQAGDVKIGHWQFKIQWTKMDVMGKFKSDDHYICYSGQEFLRRNGVALLVNKRESKMQYLRATSQATEWSRFVAKANHPTSQLSKSMPRLLMPKKVMLISPDDQDTYKTI